MEVDADADGRAVDVELVAAIAVDFDGAEIGVEILRLQRHGVGDHVLGAHTGDPAANGLRFIVDFEIGRGETGGAIEQQIADGEAEPAAQGREAVDACVPRSSDRCRCPR